MERLVSPKKTKEIINKYGFKFSKSLGQNFLIDENIIKKILDSAQITKEDIVIEVGPGIGTLTQALATQAHKVVAVEIDKHLLPILQDTLSDFNNVEVIHADILKLDIENLIQEIGNQKSIKVIANLPYYVTTPIIMHFLEKRIPIESMVVMVQKEVADRMQSAPGTKDYSTLSVAVQYYCEPQMVTRVSRTVFIPQPNVDSAVIKLVILKEPRIVVKDESLFFRIIKAAFSKRRKTLLNALAGSNLGIDKEIIKMILERSDIQGERRGETLKIEEFAKLTDALYDHVSRSR